MHKILVIGAVRTTAQILKSLYKHKFNIVGVLGHEPANKDKVSGWYNLKELSDELDLDYKGFQRINDAENIEWAKNRTPDIIFAVGFSQLMKKEWLSLPKLGCIGFHPTLLPRGRGRAPIAWSILEEDKAAVNFFLMGEGADDGPIFIQRPFNINKLDDAESLEQKLMDNISVALDEWLPRLKKGYWEPEPQNDKLASWYGKRNPEDGHINWNNSADYIDRLIKASTKPHPGAYTYFADEKIIIWKSELEEGIPIKGVVGRVLMKDEIKGSLIQCGEGLVWIRNLEPTIPLKIGQQLGYNIEDEIYLIKEKLKKLDV